MEVSFGGKTTEVERRRTPKTFSEKIQGQSLENNGNFELKVGEDLGRELCGEP